MNHSIVFTVALFLSVSAFAQLAAPPQEVRLAAEGRKLLENNPAGFGLKEVCPKSSSKKKEKKITKKAVQKPACKRVVDTFTVAIAAKKSSEPFLIVKADGRSCESHTAGHPTVCRIDQSGKTNGVNTEWEVSGHQVYAIRRVIGAPGKYVEVTYSPYSHTLNTGSVTSFGRSYLDAKILAAYQDLAQRGVRSLVNKSAFVHERVPRDLIHNLAVVEHIDVGRFAREPIEALMREVYTVLGLNQGLAYNYSKSTAKARGLLQVIPSTYEGIKRAYPNAGLIPDFVQGMTNHHNALKTAILLADHDLGMIPSVSLRAALFADQKKYADYIASSYNGGPSRAMRLLTHNKDHANDNGNEENRTYVRKMRAVTEASKKLFLTPGV